MITTNFFDIIIPTGDFMIKNIVATSDPLYAYKSNIYERFKNCSFFEHDVNQITDIGVGEYNGFFVREKFITDGKISLQRKNIYAPKLVWQNSLITLENGTSISVNISEASFMVDIIQFGTQRVNEIHVAQENEAELQKIIDLLYGSKMLTTESSICFTSPTRLVLESVVNGKRVQENLDFETGVVKSKQKRK